MSFRIAVAAILLAIGSHPPSILAESPKTIFDKATVKVCGDGSNDRKTGELFDSAAAKGRLRLDCWSVKDLIESAYVRYADGRDHSWLSHGSTPVEGGTALDCNQRHELDQRWGGFSCWIDSDRFTINASSKGAPSHEAMRGPLLQALLEEKFQLRVHREIREVPVFELKVAEGAPKLRAAILNNPSNFLQTPNGRIVKIDAQATSLGELARLLGLPAAGLGHAVSDKTGIAGLFDFHLEYSRDGLPPVDGPAPPSIVAALGQFGLTLEPAVGLREFLIVDHVERPSGR